MRATVAAAALGLPALAGCYNPNPPQGAPCASDNECPSSQKCVGGFCGGSEPGQDSGTGSDADAALDAPAIPLCQQWTAKHFDPCMIPQPGGDLNLNLALSNFSLDSDSGQLKGKANTTI